MPQVFDLDSIKARAANQAWTIHNRKSKWAWKWSHPKIPVQDPWGRTLGIKNLHCPSKNGLTSYYDDGSLSSSQNKFIFTYVDDRNGSQAEQKVCQQTFQCTGAMRIDNHVHLRQIPETEKVRKTRTNNRPSWDVGSRVASTGRALSLLPLSSCSKTNAAVSWR